MAKRLIYAAALSVFMALSAPNIWATDVPESARSISAIKRNTADLKTELAAKSLSLGSPVFLRITKTQSLIDPRGKLEAFIENANGEYIRFKDWDICYYSGGLGPKYKEGDGKSPEGFYSVPPKMMNPNSDYHLSFDLGFPNAYDRALGRTGSYLMVHGDCVSIGCYAMTDDSIEEIYTLVDAAMRGGQAAVPVHAFPFPMTQENMEARSGNVNIAFWQNLKEGWDAFETHKRPPAISARNKKYVFTMK